MMCMMLRVQLNIIGGYMYIDNIIKKNGLVSYFFFWNSFNEGSINGWLHFLGKQLQ